MWNKNRLIEKAQTDVQKNTQNPIFNETVFFDLPELSNDGLKSIKLDFTLLDEDLGKDDIIGHIVIGGESCDGTALEHWNQVIASPLQEKQMWHLFSESITKPNENKEPLPESEVTKANADLLVSLCYQPNSKKLIVKVFKARNLPKLDTFGLVGE